MKDVIKKLLDEKNMDDISLYVDGTYVLFEQVANIEYQGELYTLLVPKEPFEGCGEDEAVLFEFVKIDGEIEIVLVNDDNIIDAVYEEYLSML